MRPNRGALAWLCAALLFSTLSCGDNGAGPPGEPPPGCAALDDYLHVQAVARPPGTVIDAAVAGSHVFSLNREEGLFALNFSDPSDVHVVGGIPAMTDARAIASAGAWLFVANGEDGFAVVDVSNGAAPGIAKALPMAGAVVDVRVQDNRAYLANDVLGLVVVDITSPANAKLLGVENTPGKAIGVAASGTLAFVVLQPSELRVINVVDPKEPFIITSMTLPGYMEGVDAQDDRVAVAAGTPGVHFVDVTHPSNPVLAGTYNTPVNAVRVALAEDLAFIADQNGGVLVADVKDHAHPVPAAYLGAVLWAHDLSFSDGRLVIADDMSGVRVFAATTPVPAPFDSMFVDGNVYAVASMGDLVVVADVSYGLRVIDPVARSLVGSYPTLPFGANDVVVIDSLAYVAPADSIVIVDLHNPAAPVAIGKFGGPLAHHLAVSGNFGYTLEESGWIHKERINPPGNAGMFHDSGVLWTSITADEDPVLGTILYVPDVRSNVQIIPSFQMRPAAVLAVSASPRRVVIRHTDGGTRRLAYVAESGHNNGQSGVEVFDVTDIFTPVLVGKFACAGHATDIAFVDDRIVVGEGADGAEVFDLLDTARARPVGLLPATARRVAVSNGVLVTAGGRGGAFLVSMDECLR